jgi:hypothetical protein
MSTTCDDYPAIEKLTYAKTVISGKRAKKNITTTVRSTTASNSRSSQPPQPFVLAEAAANQTEEQLLDTLRQRATARRVAIREPDFLTTDEKKMTLDELWRKWKLEGQQRRAEAEELRTADYDPLGELTDAQKELPRRQIRNIITRRKNEIWAENMRGQGIQVLKCPSCHRLHTGDHHCLVTRWTDPSPNRSSPARHVVISQTPQGIQLRTTAIIDDQKILQEYERVKALKEEAETRMRLSAPLEPAPILSDDVEMATSTPATTPDTIPPLV